MDRLIEGYRMFRATYFERNRDMFNQLALGQAPKAMIISCCDSRVDPGLIFNSEPGELFIMRNVASLVPPYSPDDAYHGTSSAIEFAVRLLKVESIIVIGHSRCGGIAALLGSHEGDFIGPWMRIAESAKTRAQSQSPNATHDEMRQLCEYETIKVSLDNLRTFPWIQRRIDDGILTIQGWYFDIETGEVQALDETTGQFAAL